MTLSAQANLSKQWRSFACFVYAAGANGPKAVARVEESVLVHGGDAIGVDSLRPLRQLQTDPVCIRVAAEVVGAKKMSLPIFSGMCAAAARDMWVDFHWLAGSPPIKQANGMPACV